MKNKILISVTIPSYNRANTVGQTIESIIIQEMQQYMSLFVNYIQINFRFPKKVGSNIPVKDY